MYFLGRRRVPVELTTTVPPSELDDMRDRTRAALRLIHRHLTAQHLMEPDDRDALLVDALLDLRNTLQPGSWLLPQRAGAPVGPGASS